ncbi:hypothetical protein [Pelagibius marinus]|uniref:hypothetical protein n=1 Tax=Pelagibius marinus TaxID=2762760 RepID=UPI0018733A98|nr:hypothetical protein [Pelagibius marinus]
MKFLMLCLVAALVVGGILYHAEIEAYVADLADASSDAGSGSSVTGAMKNLGEAASGAMNKASDALSR